MVQLQLFPGPQTPNVRLLARTQEIDGWVTGWRPCTSGIAQYTIMIRSPDDPERSPRPRGGRTDKAPHRALEKTRSDHWKPDLLAALRDHGPVTFNAISVILLDQTADITGGTPLEEALWQLACAKKVAFTLSAPVLFKLHP
jgi:hypothetical protein